MGKRITKNVQDVDVATMKEMVKRAWEFHEEDPKEGREAAYAEFEEFAWATGIGWSGEGTEFTSFLASARFGITWKHYTRTGAGSISTVISKRENAYLVINKHMKGIYKVYDAFSMEPIGDYEETNPPQDEEDLARVIEKYEDPDGFDPEEFHIFGYDLKD